MKLSADITIDKQIYVKGTDVPWYNIYPFFLVHMLIFGLSGFFMAYSDKGFSLLFLYVHGGFAILVYITFYLAIFECDEVKWMFINAFLGITGITKVRLIYRNMLT